MDAFILFYDSKDEEFSKETDIMRNKFEIAVKYIEKHRKNHKALFGTMDCALNDCLYGADHSELPGSYFYRAFEHHKPAGLR